ncbi:MAG: phospho-N-acetylmuramoyl-pentapeptide-transferase [Phycisphaerae bacterium]|nr:phospho-N-acetylmuramoyl-pentapeptide-transferase [Phycisphaerae bacterium]
MIFHLLDFLLDSAPYAYRDPMLRAIIAIVLAFGTVWGLGPRVIRGLIRMKLGDRPEFDHAALNQLTQHKANVPTMGGVLILIAIAVSVLLLADLRNFYIHLALFTMLWLGTLGGVDDWLKLTAARRSGTRDGLKMYEKLLFQVGLGVMLAYFIYQFGSKNLEQSQTAFFNVLMIPFYKGDPITHGVTVAVPVFMLITVVVVAGTSNAVNLTDGMDGLASGCVALCTFVFMIMSAIVGNPDIAAYLLLPRVAGAAELAVVCGAMTGATLGFLWYNCHPAQVFMGDTGSLALGGLIGYVAIVIRHELMLFIVGGVFVIEAISVILQVSYFKYTGGKRIFRVAPIHHHFHLGGWTETQVVTRFWLIGALCAAVSLATLKLR